MRTTFTALIATMLAPGFAFASCEVPTDHVEQRQCLERKVAQLAQEVQSAQELVRARIDAWDEEPYYKSKSLALFNEAASQFQAYQASQCEFEASVAAGGNGAGDMKLDCQINLYDTYFKYLQEQVTRFEAPHA